MDGDMKKTTVGFAIFITVQNTHRIINQKCGEITSRFNN
jgi:hypothetical protein